MYGRDGDGASGQRLGHRLWHGAKKSVNSCTGAKTLLCSGIDERKKLRNLGKKRRANLFCGFDLNTAAEHFGVGVSGFSEEVFIVGADGEEGGIDACEGSAEALDLISSEADGDVDLLFL